MSATLPWKAIWVSPGPSNCSPHSMRRSPDCFQAFSPDHSRPMVNLPFGSNFGPRYWRNAGVHCSWLICLMRSSDGGAALGPYSLPGNVRMSTASATSKRCSSVQETMCAPSGSGPGQFRQSPVLTWSNVSLPRGPSASAPALSAVLAPSLRGSAVISPAMSNPPSAVSSSARRVEAACRLCHQCPSRRSPVAASWSSGCSGASNIRSIVTGVSRAVTTDTDVTLRGCA